MGVEIINYDKWVKDYEPVMDAVDGVILFQENPFKDTNKIKRLLIGVSEADFHAHLWTLVSNGDEEIYMSGAHFVNRLGYVFTKRPWAKSSENINDFDITVQGANNERTSNII